MWLHKPEESLASFSLACFHNIMNSALWDLAAGQTK